MKKTIAALLCGLMLLTACGTLNNLQRGAGIGAAGGAVAGAALGTILGNGGRSAAIGAAIGAAVGASAGAIIGHKMDKKAEELAALENAKVETLKDANGLEAIKVTFDSGILFATGKSDLGPDSQANLMEFAKKMADLPDTDFAILGHTDNTGSAAVNEKLSAERAQKVASFLVQCGIAAKRMNAEGRSYLEPVADNGTSAGRAKNRRVEIYIYANENMIQEATSQAN